VVQLKGWGGHGAEGRGEMNEIKAEKKAERKFCSSTKIERGKGVTNLSTEKPKQKKNNGGL